MTTHPNPVTPVTNDNDSDRVQSEMETMTGDEAAAEKGRNGGSQEVLEKAAEQMRTLGTSYFHATFTNT